ncbi:hypothetical protein MAR_034381 [Mya arenaria]|uniref:Uncharacterized protein n=1 Tax=Mya arenaria TaxID=6604 RepID=A0ABY7GET5_MYAAR|nr:hypothetical protein MAR_034381 [Mya arenaria]
MFQQQVIWVACKHCQLKTSVDSINDTEPLSPQNLLTLKSKVIVPPPANFLRADLYKEALKTFSILGRTVLVKMEQGVPSNFAYKTQLSKSLSQSKSVETRIDSVTVDKDGLVRKAKLSMARNLNARVRSVLSEVVLERSIHKLGLVGVVGERDRGIPSR